MRPWRTRPTLDGRLRRADVSRAIEAERLTLSPPSRLPAHPARRYPARHNTYTSDTPSSVCASVKGTEHPSVRANTDRAAMRSTRFYHWHTIGWRKKWTREHPVKRREKMEPLRTREQYNGRKVGQRAPLARACMRAARNRKNLDLAPRRRTQPSSRHRFFSLSSARMENAR